MPLSVTDLAALSSDFKGQVIGFSVVVPIPDRLVTRFSTGTFVVFTSPSAEGEASDLIGWKLAIVRAMNF